MRGTSRRWQHGLAALVVSGAILVGGCAERMMTDGDKGMGDKGMGDKGMMQEKGGTMEKKR